MPRNKSFLHDEEFGDIEIRRVRGAFIRIKVQPDGKMIAQLPYFVPLREVTKLLDRSRKNLRETLQKKSPKKNYESGDRIGKSHKLLIQKGATEGVKLKKLEIIISITEKTSESARIQLVKDGIAKALRKEAKAYLPRRLKFLAQQNGFSFNQIRLTHAKSRWGSCSSRGTISLNIMLMTLPNELIDYVLLHELTHTIHMNHSPKFWVDLEKICTSAKKYRKELRNFSPYL